jgi:RNA polymerase sigma factor (sigma-70 family)
MDNLLLPLLNARNEQERQQRLDELLRIHVAPIIKQVLRQRLGFYVSAQGVNENNHDAEDLYQEAMTRMVQVLHTTQRSLTTIDNFERYAGRVVSNICVDFLRSKYPARARLKEGLRDVFRRHRDLASWQYKNEILCGFAVWRNTGKRVVAAYDVDTKLDAFLSARFADEDVKVVPLSRIVAELFDWIGGPVQIDVLVRILAYVLDISEHQIESLDSHIAAEFEINFRGSTRFTELQVEANEMLGQLWRIVKRLPPRQRDAFALSFRDQAGRDLFTLLLAAGIVDWKDLTDGLKRSAADVARLWMQMPMDTETTASELNSSRKNVSKWRFRAIRKLKAGLRGEKSW